MRLFFAVSVKFSDGPDFDEIAIKKQHIFIRLMRNIHTSLRHFDYRC